MRECLVETKVARSVHVPVGEAGKGLVGDLSPPPAATGLVVFAHGSGSSRHSGPEPRHARWNATASRHCWSIR